MHIGREQGRIDAVLRESVGCAACGERPRAEKTDFVNPEVQAKKDAEKTSATTADGETVDVERL